MSFRGAHLTGATHAQRQPLVAAVAATAAMQHQFAPGVSLSLAATVFLLPVWWGALREYRFARPLVLTGFAAILWGAALTWIDPIRDTSAVLLRAQSLAVLTFFGAVGVLLWCRSQFGVANTVIFYGLGTLLNTALRGADVENLWKFRLAVPVAIFVLGLALRAGRARLEIITLLALGGISAISDSRSMTAFFVLAAAIVAIQEFTRARWRLPGPWQMIILLALFSVAALNLFQALLTEGAFGESAQQRTQAQLDASGSLLTGGRPEIGASIALILDQPWGHGSGTLPNFYDINVGKTGMSALNYDPNNGYVTRYMFGGQYEVHSTVGDFWIRFGPLGAAASLFLIAVAIYAVARSLSRGVASGIMVYLLLLGVWDTLFSPLVTSYRVLALLFALTAIPLASHDEAPPELPQEPDQPGTAPHRRARPTKGLTPGAAPVAERPR